MRSFIILVFEEISSENFSVHAGGGGSRVVPWVRTNGYKQAFAPVILQIYIYLKREYVYMKEIIYIHTYKRN